MWPGAQNRRVKGWVLISGLLQLLIMMPSGGQQDALLTEFEGAGAVEIEVERALPDVRGWVPDDSAVLLPTLKGLTLQRPSASREKPVDAVRLIGVTVDEQTELQLELGEWLGRPLTEEGLDRLLTVVLRHYDDHHRPVTDVLIPDQEGAGGHLWVQVLEGRVGRLEVKGAEEAAAPWWAGIHVQPGALLRANQVQEDLDWLGRNPFRTANLLVAPGEIGFADLIMEVEEGRPWRVYAGYDNKGTEAVGEHRWLAGFNWGSDHLIGYQMTLGGDPNSFQAHAFSWEIPFHASHQFLRLSGAWADVTAESTVGGIPLASDGTTWQLAASYGMALGRRGGWKQELRFGFEFKRSESLATFGEVVVPGATLEVAQLRVGWQGTRDLWDGEASLGISLVGSPGGLGSDDAEFALFRAGARSRSVYGQVAGEWRRALSAWELRLRTSGQLASGALVPSEQLALGGAESVRGFSERELLAESGYVVSGEILTPVLNFSDQRFVPILRGIVFLDHGSGWRRGEGWESRLGLGLGIRARWSDWLSAQLDWAIGFHDGAEGRVHAGLFASF